MKDNNLTLSIDCFTFKAEQIYEEPHEHVRSAGPHKRKPDQVKKLTVSGKSNASPSAKDNKKGSCAGDPTDETVPEGKGSGPAGQALVDMESVLSR